MAQHNANLKSKRVQICWRAHRTSVFPKTGVLRKKDYIQRLITALKSIRTTTLDERNVNSNYFLYDMNTAL